MEYLHQCGINSAIKNIDTRWDAQRLLTIAETGLGETRAVHIGVRRLHHCADVTLAYKAVIVVEEGTQVCGMVEVDADARTGVITSGDARSKGRIARGLVASDRGVDGSPAVNVICASIAATTTLTRVEAGGCGCCGGGRGGGLSCCRSCDLCGGDGSNDGAVNCHNRVLDVRDTAGGCGNTDRGGGARG